MSQNLISQTMTDAQRVAMLEDLAAYEEKFADFKCLLTPDQIRRLSKLKPADVALLVIVSTYAAQNLGAVPADMNVPEMNKDIALAQQLAQLDAKLEQLHKMVRCSLIATMSDGFAQGRQIYRVEKAKGRTPANAAFLDAFGEYFERGSRETDPNPDPDPQPPTP